MTADAHCCLSKAACLPPGVARLQQTRRHPPAVAVYPWHNPSPGGAQAGWGGPSADTGITGQELEEDWGRGELAVQPRLVDPAGTSPKALPLAGPRDEETAGSLAGGAGGRRRTGQGRAGGEGVRGKGGGERATSQLGAGDSNCGQKGMAGGGGATAMLSTKGPPFRFGSHSTRRGLLKGQRLPAARTGSL